MGLLWDLKEIGVDIRLPRVPWSRQLWEPLAQIPVRKGGDLVIDDASGEQFTSQRWGLQPTLCWRIAGMRRRRFSIYEMGGAGAM